MRILRDIFLSFVISALILCFAGCSSSDAPKEKTVVELIDELHDIDTETTVLYNNFDGDYTKFYDFSEAQLTAVDEINTLQAYSNNSIESGRRAQDEFNRLFEKISLIKSKELRDSERGYVEKLELAGISYNQTIAAKLRLTNSKTKLAKYQIYNVLFFDSYMKVYDSIVTDMAFYEGQENWDMLSKEITSARAELDKASQNVDAMKEALAIDSAKSYKEWITLMRDYLTKVKPLYEKEKAGQTIPQAELNAITDILTKAADIFQVGDDDLTWAPDEKDELEAYRRENVYPYEKEGDESYNRADAYYQDAKLKYQQLVQPA